MKLTLSWLKDHLETSASLDEITTTLTRIGLEVEEVEDKSAALAPYRVAYVVSAEQHPNADRLKVCIVDTGAGQVQVVCGAPNARTGMKGVFAPTGTHIPGTGLDLKASKVRGVESNGMLVSEREMGLSDEHAGILELPDDAPVGTPFARLLGLEPVLNVMARNLDFAAQRRIEIGRSLMSGPRLLLLDEPTAGVDAHEAAELVALVKRMQVDLGLAVLLIEHYVQAVMENCNPIYVLDQGTLIACGTPSEVARDPKVRASYLGESGTGKKNA